MADDMGWADVGYHCDHILTPNIDTLAADGVVLNNFYVQPASHPSRGALLTGRHPMHFGFQHGALMPYMATDEHNTSEPLFLYMPHQALHVSVNELPVEAPQEYIDMFAYIESDMRRGLA
ncbi:unnamed protein product, partial [Oppiella nova]